MSASQADLPLSTFVSFADREADRDFVRLLLPRLNEQPLRVWNYQREGDEIPIGTPIADHLTQMIEQSRVFLVVVSNHALRSRWVEQEVACALERQRAGLLQIIPIVSRELAVDRGWPGSFSFLADLCAQPIEFHSPEDLENSVQRICRTLRIPFRPLLPEHPRLPYRTRFLDEFRDACEARLAGARAAEHDRGTFEYLMRLLGQFGAAARDHRTHEALRAIRLFCLVCEHEFPEVRLYYPSLTQGAWEMLCGDLETAERTLERVKARGNVDESVHTALGHLALEKGEYARAAACYRQAQALCPNDSAASHGVLLAEALSGVPVVDLDAVLDRLDADASIVGNDRVKVQELKALVWKVAGRSVESAALYAALVNRKEATAGAILQYADLLQQEEKFDKAYDLLNRSVRLERASPIVLEAARMAAFHGEADVAEGWLQELIEGDRANRVYRLELAIIYWNNSDFQRAADVLSELLSHETFGLPQTEVDFYCDGAAQWVCGDRKRARYDFERSGYPAHLSYEFIFAEA
jgi:tetratricopeptide (TPR) repeat protein